MEDKNLKRRNEALKEVAETQQEINDFNRDIYKINYVLMYGDYKQREECRCDIVRKYPNYAQYLDNRSLLLNLLCNDPTIILRMQILALTNMKSTHCFQEYIKRGMKLQVKWRLEDM
jgi:hypothetical protein